MKKIYPLLILSFVMMLIMCACSKEVTLTVFDSGNTSTVKTNTGTTVETALKEANISVAANDEVYPSLDSLISEDTDEIKILRYAKVTVIKGLDSKEVELVGGTVQDAVEKSGFSVSEGEELDQNANGYLTDGMIITITREISVTLNADGVSKDIRTKAVTVKDFLDEQNITLGENDELSEKTDSLLREGMKITLKRVEYKEETVTESIDYETVEKSDDSMYKGESKTTQEGSKGEKTITYKVKYVDGEEDSKEKLNEKVTKEPTDKIVVYGTKSRKLTEDEAEAIAKDFWKLSDDDELVLFNSGLKISGGTEYYSFILKWRVDDGGGKFHYSAVDYVRVDAYTGEVTNIL